MPKKEAVCIAGTKKVSAFDAKTPGWGGPAGALDGTRTMNHEVQAFPCTIPFKRYNEWHCVHPQEGNWSSEKLICSVPQVQDGPSRVCWTPGPVCYLQPDSPLSLGHLPPAEVGGSGMETFEFLVLRQKKGQDLLHRW